MGLERVRRGRRAPKGTEARARRASSTGAGHLARVSPLLVLAGCLLDSGAFPGGGEVGPIEANTVACDCTFAESGSRALRVQASTDDAEQVGASMELQSLDLDLGDEHVGLRFDTFGLPPGAVIQSAYVQFTADESQSDPAEVSIRAQVSVDAPTFSSDDDDITGRSPLSAATVDWSIDPWSSGDAGAAQRTPDLAPLLQELVDLQGWKAESPVVLIFAADAGLRNAESFDGAAELAPELVVTYDTALSTTIETCASDRERDADGYLVDPQATCDTLQDTLAGLNAACGLPQAVTCAVVDQEDPNGEDIPDSYPDEVCAEPCAPNEVDAPECTEYDPVGLAECLNLGNSLATCKPLYATATHAGDDTPVCVASGSPLAFDAVGRRSLCEVEGTATIVVGGTEPRQDPTAEGVVELLGGPCPDGDCYVHPSFVLDMEPVTFEVLFASDPTFEDLGLAGAADEATQLADGLARFGPDGVRGTGRGRSGPDGLAIRASNPEVVVFEVDWTARLCELTGALAVGVGDDGVCANDDTIPCRTDDDCARAGGTCDLPDELVEMSAGVTLRGELVNQPPTAAAGADQVVECTSPDGAAFVLDGRGSRDPDGDLAVASWRLGSRTGRAISDDLRTTQALGIGDTQTYVLRVLDTYAQLDEDPTTVSAVDATPPTIDCGAPETLRPRDAAQTFTARATDTCDTSVSPTITDFDCWTINGSGRRIDKRGACKVSFTGGALTVHNTGGVDTHIGWTVEATDDAGNEGRESCEVLVTR